MTLHTLTSPLFPYTTLFRSMKRTPLSYVRGSAATTAALTIVLCMPAMAQRHWREGWRFEDTEKINRTFQRRSEEHTSELQSLRHLVCRLLLEKKKIRNIKKS